MNLSTIPAVSNFTTRLQNAPEGCTRTIYGPVDGWVMKKALYGADHINETEHYNAQAVREIAANMGVRIPETVWDEDSSDVLLMEYVGGEHPAVHWTAGIDDSYEYCNCLDLGLSDCFLNIARNLQKVTHLRDLHFQNVKIVNGVLWIIDLGNGT